MSNKRKILVYRDSKLIKEFPLNGNSLTIGRDESCDIVLNGNSVSRLHAKIIIEEANIYLENQSSTGQLFLESKQIEFAEWSENQTAKIGPFSIRWAQGEASSSESTEEAEKADVTPNEPSSQSAEAVKSDENFEFSNDWENSPEPSADEAEALSLVKPNEDNIEPKSDDENDDQEEDLKNFSSHPAKTGEVQIESGILDTNQSTKIVTNDAIGMIKVTLGETIGREIHLDQGFQWIVGRSAKCHIKIDNAKLSRQHFKIVKASGRYRIQDLGSANGTRLNGIAITDAPLSPFDTIIAGPVEFQFLVAQTNLQNVPVTTDQSFSAQEETQFAAPPMVYSGDGGGNPFAYVGAATPGNHANEGTNVSKMANGATSAPQTATSKSLTSKLNVWWKAQPKNKRLIYFSVAAIFIAMLLVPSEDKPVATQQGTKIADAAKTAQTGNQAMTPPEKSLANEVRANDISPEFYLLSAEDRRKVEDAYAKAQRARNASDWKEAVAQSKVVMKFVDKYKDITDILAESQTHFNEVILGAVTNSLKSSLDAEAQVKDQVTLLIEAGKKAISESRWPDAQDQCAKAVSLDPKNEEANKCYAAAYGQDANYAAEKVPEKIPLPNDPDANAQAQMERDLETRKQTYQAAQTFEQNANFDKALEGYTSLLSQINKEIDGIKMPGRFPASVSSTYAQKNTELKMQIEQRIKDINFQYETEYRSQMTDAEQLIANQDYVRARETYDRILNGAPNFQEARTKRAELYKRMISEARGIYHEALIYESVGDLQAAIDKYSQTKRLLAGIVHPSADEYFRKSSIKLKALLP